MRRTKKVSDEKSHVRANSSKKVFFFHLNHFVQVKRMKDQEKKNVHNLGFLYRNVSDEPLYE